MQATLVDKG